jgi:hypothetical protein
MPRLYLQIVHNNDATYEVFIAKKIQVVVFGVVKLCSDMVRRPKFQSTLLLPSSG